MSDLFAVSISTATITAMGRRTARRFERPRWGVSHSSRETDSRLIRAFADVRLIRG